MIKRKGFISKLLLLVLALTLISCCFLGGTFARYTSGGSGSATLNVANWSISIEGGGNSGSTDVEFSDKLSPSMAAYESEARTNSTGKVLVATISNTGDVDALVTVTAGDVVITLASEVNYGDGVASGDPTQAEVEEVFSIKLYTNTDGNAESATEYSQAVNVSAGSGVLYIYAEVIWTSDSASITGDTADKRDTWIGENVTSVEYTITYTAVQNSELPNS